MRALLREPLADGLDRGGGLRWAALLHDAAKPQTRVALPEGRVGFPGHDRVGAELARAALARLRASERLRAHVAALTRHHLRLGFLVHDAPLDRRAVHRYLVATAPVSADVTLLTVADRLATRGRNAEPAIARHVALAAHLLDAALEQRAAGPAAPLVRGDALAAALGLRPGPQLGRAAGRDRGGALRRRGRDRRRGRRAGAPGARRRWRPAPPGGLAAAELVGPGARGRLVVEGLPADDQVARELHDPGDGPVQGPVPAVVEARRLPACEDDVAASSSVASKLTVRLFHRPRRPSSQGLTSSWPR